LFLLLAVALVLGLTALPGSATFAKKFEFKLIAPSGPVAAGSTNVQVTATFKNKSLYTIKSLYLGLPSGFSVVSGSNTANGLTLKLGTTYTLSFEVDIACNATGGPWDPRASTSSTFSYPGNFTPTSTPPSTGVGPAAPDHLQFAQQPTDTAVNTNISPAVLVEAIDVCGNKVNNVAVDMTKATGPGSLSGTSPQSTGPGGTATFADLQLDKPSVQPDDYSLQASAAGFGMVDSDFFTVADTVLDCENPTYDEGGFSIDVGENCETPVAITVTYQKEGATETYNAEKVGEPTLAAIVTIDWEASTALEWTQVEYPGSDGFVPVEPCGATNPGICLLSGEAFGDGQWREVFSLLLDPGFKRGGGG
jgi:hypothetical protein